MRRPTRILASLILPAVLASSAVEARAGSPLFRNRERNRVAPVSQVVDPRPENRVAPSPMLGTMQPSNYITVRGNFEQGGGYAPLGFYGFNNSMDVFGPISALRATSAPVTTITRGYNGVPVVEESTAFSTPLRPSLSPVKYPTRASLYSGPRNPVTPPRPGNAILWIDQN